MNSQDVGCGMPAHRSRDGRALQDESWVRVVNKVSSGIGVYIRRAEKYRRYRGSKGSQVTGCL